jgi:hypothetical protein
VCIVHSGVWSSRSTSVAECDPCLSAHSVFGEAAERQGCVSVYLLTRLFLLPSCHTMPPAVCSALTTTASCAHLTVQCGLHSVRFLCSKEQKPAHVQHQQYRGRLMFTALCALTCATAPGAHRLTLCPRYGPGGTTGCGVLADAPRPRVDLVGPAPTGTSRISA